MLVGRSLAALGIEQAVFCVSRAGLTEEQIPMSVFQASRAAKWNWASWRDLSRSLRSFRPQVVHAWLPASINIPAMTLAHAHGARVVFSYRSRMYFHRPISVPEWLVALLRTDRVASNTPIENCSSAYRFLYRKKQGVCIPNAVSMLDAVRKATWEIASGAPLSVLYVGRLSSEKNFDCLLQALASLRDLRWQLTVCGQGPEESRVRALAAQLAIAENVRWLGFRKDVARIMSEHDLLVLPSWREGSPNVALEAMAAGLPCLLSRIPAHRFLFEADGAALLFDPASPAALAAALREAAGDTALRRDLAERALACVSGYSPEAIARKYADLYREMAMGVA